MRTLSFPIDSGHQIQTLNKLKEQLDQSVSIKLLSITDEQIRLKTDRTFEQLFTQFNALNVKAGHEIHLTLQGLSCKRCVATLRHVFDDTKAIHIVSLSKTQCHLYSAIEKSHLIKLIASAGYKAHSTESKTPLTLNTNAPKCRAPGQEDSKLTSITDGPSPSSLQVISADQESGELNDPFTLTANPKPSITKASNNVHHRAQNVQSEAIRVMQISIDGMHCASCVASVENAFQQVNATHKTYVNLAEHKAILHFEGDEALYFQAISEGAKRAGYQIYRLDSALADQTQSPSQQQPSQRGFGSDNALKNAIFPLTIGTLLMGWGTFGGSMALNSSTERLSWGLVGIICLFIMLTFGKVYYQRGLQSLKYKRANMDTLIALGTGSAWLYSMTMIIFAPYFPQEAKHLYFEASMMILGLISLGHFIEGKGIEKTTSALKKLIQLQPDSAIHITATGEVQISSKAILKDMLIKILPGHRIPIDGKVISGKSYVDESMLTGEPLPVEKRICSKVSAGTFNQDGLLVIEATTNGDKTVLSRIIAQVEQAQSSKPQIARLADTIAAYFVPAVILIALLSAMAWYLFGPEPKYSYVFVVIISVLIIACPCALGLATPLSVTVGIGKGAELGILIQDADVLQTANKIDTLVFDKTGTLTEGKPIINHLFTQHVEPTDFLTTVYSICSQSTHPFSTAINAYISQQDNAYQYTGATSLSQFKNLPGAGLYAQIDHHDIYIGSINLMKESNIDLTEVKEELNAIFSKKLTPVCVARHGHIIGIFGISDSIRPEAIQTVEWLKKRNIKVIMLTGDHPDVSNFIAHTLGIDEVYAQMLPEEKGLFIKKLKQDGHKVAMVGDGINDAVALSFADLSIAMGSGSDIAIESASITLIQASPLKVIDLLELSQATLTNIKRNLFFAFMYNIICIPVAAGLLYPINGFLLDPVIAGAAMALSSITVVLSANRLKHFRTKLK